VEITRSRLAGGHSRAPLGYGPVSTPVTPLNTGLLVQIYLVLLICSISMISPNS